MKFKISTTVQHFLVCKIEEEKKSDNSEWNEILSTQTTAITFGDGFV